MIVALTILCACMCTAMLPLRALTKRKREREGESMIPCCVIEGPRLRSRHREGANHSAAEQPDFSSYSSPLQGAGNSRGSSALFSQSNGRDVALAYHTQVARAQGPQEPIR
jgi:hypothetical protein